MDSEIIIPFWCHAKEEADCNEELYNRCEGCPYYNEAEYKAHFFVKEVCDSIYSDILEAKYCDFCEGDCLSGCTRRKKTEAILKLIDHTKEKYIGDFYG